jgi:hypothetical protein
MASVRIRPVSECAIRVLTASFVDGIGRPQDASYVLNFKHTQSIRQEDHDALEQIAAEIRGLRQEMGRGA